MIKRKGGSQIGNLTLDHKPLENRGQMKSNRSVLYPIGKIFSRAIRYCLWTFKKDFIWERYECPKFGTTKVRVLGLPLGSLVEKWHSDVILTKRHKIYYREGSGASPQMLWIMWSLCLRLSLLSLSHHFHSTCTNRLFFLVVIILNSHLWIRPSPILELQHTLLPPKCYE